MTKNLLALVFLLSLSCISFAHAADPDPASNPVLNALQKQGSKFYYLGNRSGLDGWFIIREGQVQIAYATPDNKGAMIGAMFGQDGENITALQVENLVRNNKEVADVIAKAQKEQAAIAQAGSPAAASPPAPSSGGLPATTLSPGERLIRDLSASSTILLGTASTPEILMVMDPRCPHCQATWKALHDAVTKGQLHIRMIPIGIQGTDNERAAAILLSTSNTMAAWDKYVAGDATALAGTPSATALAAVRANTAVIDNWQIDKTPYLVYRAKDGKVKILSGEPDKISILLTDLGV
jgi:protein-disulfide isomerase